MEQAARAGKPDLAKAVLDNRINRPDRLASAVIPIASEGSSGRIKFVQAGVYGPNPQIAATVSGEGLDPIAANAVRVFRVVAVVGKRVQSLDRTCRVPRPRLPIHKSPRSSSIRLCVSLALNVFGSSGLFW